MIKYFLVATIFLCVLYTNAQEKFNIGFHNSTFATDGKTLPFWLVANQNGKIQAEGSFLNVSELFFSQYLKHPSASLSFSWGADVVAGYSEKKYLQLNQAFAGVSYKGWELKAGMFHDSIRFSGLSTTNGNIVQSPNARPYPSIQFSTCGYRTIPFTGDLLSFDFRFREGLLNDDRFVANARLHQKSFHLKLQINPAWDIRAGFEHLVMWGGISKNNQIGQMPQDIGSYLRYITGSRGSKAFPATDRLNVAGNQLGAWQFEVKRNFQNTVATLYINHPFEDFSGVNLRNWPDNLLGIHLKLKNKKTVNELVYEYTDTRQQSIKDSLYSWNDDSNQWIRLENDNYFNHGIYRSGYTYYRQVMASPLFFPVVVEEGISKGIRSTRFYAHHAGVKGYFPGHISWKGMITYMKHLGTYSSPYEKSLVQVSASLELRYTNPAFPFELGLSAAADANRSYPLNKGIRFTVSKKW